MTPLDQIPIYERPRAVTEAALKWSTWSKELAAARIEQTDQTACTEYGVPLTTARWREAVVAEAAWSTQLQRSLDFANAYLDWDGNDAPITESQT